MSDKTVLEKEQCFFCGKIGSHICGNEESAAMIRCLTELAQETVDHLEQVEDCQRCRGLTERWKSTLAQARRSK